MFQLIYNIISAIFYSIWSTALTIITGKLAKISPYHADKPLLHDNSMFDICSDKYIKTDTPRLVTDWCKERIIKDFINHLSKDDKFIIPVNDAKFPIFDGKEIIGESNVYSVMEDSLKDYIRNGK